MKRRYILTLLILSMSFTALMAASCAEKSKNGAPASATETEEVSEDLEAPYEAEGMCFSVKSGFYDSEFDLILSSAEGEIHYTLDGTTPDRNSPVYDKLFFSGSWWSEGS